MASADYRKEFQEMGRDRVRSDLMFGRFTPEKRTEARIWLEQMDAESWQKTRGDKPRQSILRSPVVKKWLPYVGGIFLIGVLYRMLHF